MARESTLHQKILHKTLKKLRAKGFKTINTNRKIPNGIALKDNKIYVVLVLRAKKVPGVGTIKKFTWTAKRKIYCGFGMFDDIIFHLFYDSQKSIWEETIDFIKKLNEEGYKAINTEMKCPDGLAIKDNKIYGVEIVGVPNTKNINKNNKSIINKRQIYNMFDDLIIVPFSKII